MQMLAAESRAETTDVDRTLPLLHIRAIASLGVRHFGRLAFTHASLNRACFMLLPSATK